MARGHANPRPIDLAAFIAWSHRGYPKARPHCPRDLVGRWLQREPATAAPVTWAFGDDGSFAAPDSPSPFAKRTTWCVHHHVDDEERDVWLYDPWGIGHLNLHIESVTPKELRLDCLSRSIRVHLAA